MKIDIRAVGAAGCAVYLRYYPYDAWSIGVHREALCDYAAQLGLPNPRVHADNGRPSHGPLPALAVLVRLIACGVYQVLLDPGLFVFSLSDLEARSIRQQLADYGCHVLELPRHRIPRAVPAQFAGEAQSAFCANDSRAPRERR